MGLIADNFGGPTNCGKISPTFIIRPVEFLMIQVSNRYVCFRMCLLYFTNEKAWQSVEAVSQSIIQSVGESKLPSKAHKLWK